MELLYLRTFVPWNFRSNIEICMELSSPKTKYFIEPMQAYVSMFTSWRWPICK